MVHSTGTEASWTCRAACHSSCYQPSTTGQSRGFPPCSAAPFSPPLLTIPGFPAFASAMPCISSSEASSEWAPIVSVVSYTRAPDGGRRVPPESALPTRGPMESNANSRCGSVCYPPMASTMRQHRCPETTQSGAAPSSLDGTRHRRAGGSFRACGCLTHLAFCLSTRWRFQRHWPAPPTHRHSHLALLTSRRKHANAFNPTSQPSGRPRRSIGPRRRRPSRRRRR